MGPDDRGVGVQVPVESRILRIVQTGPDARQASYPVGMGGRGKAAGA
jgi:hypothetical protein